jgi:hypothetical protein
MVMRRQLVLGAVAGGVVLPMGVGCASGTDEQEAARNLRRPLDISADPAMRMHELVRYATLAPSSHNTQCWNFHLQDRGMVITPDVSRRCPVVDPDEHHLYVSLGCATENLAHAALAAGLQTHVGFDASGAGAISVALEATKPLSTPLFQALAQRQCTRTDYYGKQISNDELHLLEQAGTGNRVRVMLLTEPAAIENVVQYVVAGNTAQMNDAAFVAELKQWIRFGASEALQAGDGLFSATTGSPVVPRWLGSPLMGLFYTAASENERYAKQIRSSAGIAVFVSETNDRAHWVEAGRCYERLPCKRPQWAYATRM